MNQLINFNVSENCIICNQFGDFGSNFYQLSSLISNHSKKPLIEIIVSLFQTPTFTEDSNSSICENCLTKINNFDAYNYQASQLRQELIDLHEKSKSNGFQIDVIDTFQINLTNEFNLEQDSDGIFIVQESVSDAKLITNDEKTENNEFNKETNFCDECGKKFRTINSLKVHFAADHERRKTQLPCWICNKKCADKNALRAHLICHKDEKKFSCYCGKAFSYKISYTQHLKIHDNVREFECKFDSCNFKAFTATHLKRHERARHTKEKNHQCSVCGKCFAEKYNMKSHIKKQHSKPE